MPVRWHRVVHMAALARGIDDVRAVCPVHMLRGTRCREPLRLPRCRVERLPRVAPHQIARLKGAGCRGELSWRCAATGGAAECAAESEAEGAAEAAMEAAEEAAEKAAEGTHLERAARGCVPEVDLGPYARVGVVDEGVPRRPVAQGEAVGEGEGEREGEGEGEGEGDSGLGGRSCSSKSVTRPSQLSAHCRRAATTAPSPASPSAAPTAPAAPALPAAPAMPPAKAMSARSSLSSAAKGRAYSVSRLRSASASRPSACASAAAGWSGCISCCGDAERSKFGSSARTRSRGLRCAAAAVEQREGGAGGVVCEAEPLQPRGLHGVGIGGRREVHTDLVVRRVGQAEAVVKHEHGIGRLADVAVARRALLPARDWTVCIEDEGGALRLAAACCIGEHVLCVIDEVAHRHEGSGLRRSDLQPHHKRARPCHGERPPQLVDAESSGVALSHSTGALHRRTGRPTILDAAQRAQHRLLTAVTPGHER
eukprot:scaffold23058_cov68-Phaeocystis_antarctica.AAC.13